MAVKEKTAAELIAEAEEVQKKFAPELYVGEEDTAGEQDKGGISDVGKSGEEPAPGAAPGENKEKLPDDDKEKKPDDTDKTDYKAEYEKLKAQHDALLHAEDSARGRLTKVADENRTLKEKVADLEGTITDLQKAKDQAGRKESAETAIQGLIEEYGEDSLAVKFARENNALKEELGSLRDEIKGITGAVARTGRGDYLAQLTAEVSDWQTLKDDPRIVPFLHDEAPFTGRTFYDIMFEADKIGDAKTVGDIYRAFKSSITPSTSTDKGAEDEGKKEPEDVLKAKAAKDKEKFITPGSGKGGGGEGGQEPQTFTAGELKKAKEKIFALKQNGRHEEAKKIQAEVDAYLDSLSG
jgi:hypothetical protein